MTPRVTVVVPTQNEAPHISDCLTAIAAQDHPLDDIQVVVVDGDSDDGTAEIAHRLLSEIPFACFEVIQNPEATTPSNLNRGLAAAVGDYVVRVDARSTIPLHYVRTVVGILQERPDVAVVGGTQRAVPPDKTPLSVGIARALNNRWSTGLARYRRTAESGASDTVYLGTFRTRQLCAAGGWNTRFTTNQDFELNRRMSEQGVVWYVGGLVVGYRPRSSLGQLWRQYVRFGRWKTIYWATTGDAPQRRQRLIVLGPLGTLGLVLAASVIVRNTKPVLVGSAIAAAGLVIIERFGADEPCADARGHAAGVAAIAVVSGGWLAGVYSGLVTTAVREARSRR